MRVAVMSDIHGFDLALATVLEDLAGQGEVGETIVAGDLCEVGPAPAAVLEVVRARRLTVLSGNTDRDLVEASAAGHRSGEIGFALNEIGEEGVRYLAGLPFSRRITPPGGASPVDDLLAVHANPWDLDRKLHPEMSDRALREVVGDAKAAVIAFGHVHIAYVRRLDQTLLVDVSAVGNPKDGDLRCKYGLFTWDEAAHRWDVEIRRLPYPLEATEAQIRASALPAPSRTLRKLLRASY
ncbi:MAG: metallophosphatase family protein [Chloroflexota bacterium]|nr:metallophosphatase family protein [Chloroflexota bacterium]